MTNEDYSKLVAQFSEIATNETASTERLVLKRFKTSPEAQVLSGLLARQLRLVWSLLNSPMSLNHDAAPLFLRSMADTYINAAYILRSPAERADQFIKYGLGDELLQIAHLEEAAGGVDDSDEITRIQEAIDARRGWIEWQRALWAIDVNLGSWAGKNTRDMAKDAEEEGFYKYVYKPFSACVHSTWGHIGKWNVKRCIEPLHKEHFVGNFDPPDFNISYIDNAIKYLQMLIDEVRYNSVVDGHAILPDRDLIYAYYSLCDEILETAREDM